MTRREPDPPSTDFAITSVNVPDRLDMLELHGRAHQNPPARSRRHLRRRGRVWVVRIVALAVVGVVGWEAAQTLEAARAELSPAAISLRLSRTLGVPVHIADSRLRLSPAPHLELDGVDVGDQVTIPAVSLQLQVRNIGRLLVERRLDWGAGEIAPLSLNPAQARFLLGLLPRLRAALPDDVGALRCAALALADTIPGGAAPWTMVTDRSPGGGFDRVTLTRSAGSGSVQLTLSPAGQSAAGGAAEAISFQLDETGAPLPTVPRETFDRVRGRGTVERDRIVLDSLVITDRRGGLRAHAVVQRDATGWALRGAVDSGQMDVAAVLGDPAGSDAADGGAPPLLAGTALISGRLAGRGDTVANAFADLSFTGRVAMQDGTLNGVDLGYAATHPGGIEGSGGSTPFRSGTASLDIGRDGVALRDIRLRAGALAVVGEVTVTGNRRLSGSLFADLIDAMRAQAPVRVTIRGTVAQPTFGG